MDNNWNKEWEKLEVHGSLLGGFIQACMNLAIIGGDKAKELAQGVEIMNWYPFRRYKDLEEIIRTSYRESAPILEKSGREMMLGWYHHGPGKDIVKKGVDFLTFQAGSQGYSSVVKGPEEIKGGFFLRKFDPKAGTATIESTNPFDPFMQKGVILGGMSAPGDLSFINADNSKNPRIYEVEFH